MSLSINRSNLELYSTPTALAISAGSRGAAENCNSTAASVESSHSRCSGEDSLRDHKARRPANINSDSGPLSTNFRLSIFIIQISLLRPKTIVCCSVKRHRDRNDYRRRVRVSFGYGITIRGCAVRNHSGLEIGTSDHELSVRRW